MTFDHRLAQAFLFDESDLAVNRIGRFSEDQARLLSNTAAVATRRAPGRAIALFLLFAVLVVLAAFTVARSGGSGTQLTIVFAILAGFGLLIVLLQRHARRRATALLSAVVRVVEGAADVSLHSSGGASALTSYRVVVSGQRFVVDSEQAEAFTDGRAYRVHFIEGMSGLMILSAEPV